VYNDGTTGWGTLECCQLLLEAGADTNSSSCSGESPTDVALQRGRHVITDLLQRWLPLGLTVTETETLATEGIVRAGDNESDAKIAQVVHSSVI
jgi:hypothetical protein